MRVEQAHLLQVDTNITVKPGASAEQKLMKESVAGDSDLSNSAQTKDSGSDSNNRKIQFFIHEKTGDIIVKVYDAETNEVIREIPPEKIKDMVANMLERAGLLVDERA